MNIELKKVKTFIGNEGHGFNAEVWIDGVRTCLAIDDASGSIEYQFHVYDQAKFKELEAYVETLPDHTWEYDGKTHTIPASMEQVVEDAMKKFELAKAMKKLEKKFVNHIVWGNKDFKGDYTYVKFKNPLDTYPAGFVQKAIDTYKLQLETDEIFYNTNFESLKIKV